MYTKIPYKPWETPKKSKKCTSNQRLRTVLSSQLHSQANQQQLESVSATAVAADSASVVSENTVVVGNQGFGFENQGLSENFRPGRCRSPADTDPVGSSEQLKKQGFESDPNTLISKNRNKKQIKLENR